MSESKINDGGPAFPFSVPVGDGSAFSRGMSLRDYFAGQIIAALVARPDVRHVDIARLPDEMAALAYGFADAMLDERDGSLPSRSSEEG